MTAFCANERRHPIPPPSHPRQYRAIGLVYGQYYPSGESITRGVFSTEEGVLIEAVLLGRMMSLVKKHLDLNQPHLWVVYPRMRDLDHHLHFQLAGVWEPETLKPQLPLASLGEPLPQNQKGQFSIRGEVVFADPEKEAIILKIRQTPRPDPDNPHKVARPKSFKIRLQGKLSERPLGHFWDLQVQLQRDILLVESSKDLGFVITKRVPRSDGDRRPPRRLMRSDRPFTSRNRDSSVGMSKPVPKPVKRDPSDET